jgi:hypothetical protein
MAYEGAELFMCPKDMFDFENAYAVVVSGDRFNPWGHMLLNTGGTGGVYFQVAGNRKCPRYMSEAGYQLYLRENKKKELKRFRVYIPEPGKGAAEAGASIEPTLALGGCCTQLRDPCRRRHCRRRRAEDS